MILRICVADCCVGLLILGLAQFHNRAEPQLVSRFRKTKSKVRLFKEICRYGDTLKGCIGRQPRSADIANDLISQVAALFRRRLRTANRGLFGLGRVK